MPPPSEPLLVIVGPTASGKTELALSIAEGSDGEIVSADSVQVYRGFDIGSGKPSEQERHRIPHHLIDCADPLDAMDAARWAALADSAIADIRARNKTPIICGGTFLWVRALLYGLAPAPPADPDVRRRHESVVESRGRPALHAELSSVDPATASRLSPNDFVRVSRALEVYELTGTPMSKWQTEHGFRTTRHDFRLVGIGRSREDLNARIAARVRAMLDAGWIDEVRGLVSRGYRGARAMNAVGYRQIAEAVDSGDVRPDALFETIDRATRIFARRQRTWLRDQPVEWLDPQP
jgi:tRNA dimethylallyltransferase